MHRWKPFTLALLLAGLVAGCHGSHGWSTADRQAFLSRCEKQQAKASCTCVLDALQRTLSASEYQALSATGTQAHAPPPAQMAKVRDAVMTCQTEAR